MILSAFKTYVLQDFKRTDKDLELVQAYNDSIVAISIAMPHGSYKFTSYVPTVAGQGNYPLPSDLIYMIHPARLLEGSGASDSGFKMDFITKEEYDSLELNPNRTNPPTGRPIKYCVFSRSILPHPIPDKSSYFIEIDWTKRPEALSGNSDVSALGSEWDEVLKFMTMARLNAGIELFQEAQYWESKFQDPFGNPIGMFRRLLDIEKDRESRGIGCIRNNSL
jgi:hypothetical protein